MGDSTEITKEALWTKDFVILIISSLLATFGFQLLVPTLPMYISSQGGSSADIGLVISALTFVAVITRPFSGAASDALGRKSVLAVGVFICLFSIVFYSRAFSVSSILLVRVIHGIGWGITTSAFGALASDVVPASRRGEGIGYFAYAALVDGAMGPLVGIQLLDSFSFNAVLIFAAVCTLISLTSLFLIRTRTPKILRERAKQSETIREQEIQTQPEPLLSKLLEKTSLFPSLLMIFLGMVYGGIVTFITLFGAEVSNENVGLFFLIYALSSFLIRPLSGKVFDTKGHFFVLLPGAVITLLGVMVLSYATSALVLALAGTFIGVGMGAVQPSLQAWVISRAAPHRRGVATSTFFSAFDIGIAGGAVVLGSVAEIFNYAIMYRLSSLILVIFIVVYIIHNLFLTDDQKYNDNLPLN